MNIKTLNLKDTHYELSDDSIQLGNHQFPFKISDHLLTIQANTLDIYALTAIEILLGLHPAITQVKTPDQEISRSIFYQMPNFWCPQAQIKPEVWNREAERPHPVREDIREGVLYSRYIPKTGKTLTFRGTDIEKDLDIFHSWHNQQRVYHFWELNQSKEELKSYMEKIKADPHMIPSIVEFDGKPVGYFEMYWTLEDRLGPYYPADAFDRGFHFLIGEVEALGFDNTDAVLKSVLHYLFLNDARTRRVMAEPRHDNKKVLRYAQLSGWSILKEFDFPHKRAALLECKRENFFNGVNF